MLVGSATLPGPGGAPRVLCGPRRSSPARRVQPPPCLVANKSGHERVQPRLYLVVAATRNARPRVYLVATRCYPATAHAGSSLREKREAEHAAQYRARRKLHPGPGTMGAPAGPRTCIAGDSIRGRARQVHRSSGTPGGPGIMSGSSAEPRIYYATCDGAPRRGRNI